MMPDPRFDVLRFNQDLAERLRPWLPTEVRLTASSDAITLENDRGETVTQFVADLFDRSPAGEAAVRAAHQILDAVQDFVSDELGEPWPALSDDDATQAIPSAEERDGVVELWYGDQVEPALALSPMRLAEYRG
jgi:hypothetical protein